jgi:hypothetical protein
VERALRPREHRRRAIRAGHLAVRSLRSPANPTRRFHRGGPGSLQLEPVGMVPHIDEAFLQLAADWLSQADALLLGRRTYDNFARNWPQIKDPNDRFGKRMNGLAKYVASRSVTHAEWAPTTILSGDVRVETVQDQILETEVYPLATGLDIVVAQGQRVGPTQVSRVTLEFEEERELDATTTG